MRRTKERSISLTKKADRERHIDIMKLSDEFKAAGANITGITVNALHDVPQEVVVHFNGEPTLTEEQIREIHRRHVSEPKKKLREVMAGAAPEKKQKLIEDLVLRRFGDLEVDDTDG